MDEQLVIQIKYGGLGDHLFHSHIPRIAKESGKYNKVFISNFSDFRNKDYKKLVWETNPFVDGFIDQPGMILPEINYLPNGLNLLDQIMLNYNLDDNKRFHEPEIYYRPRLINELKDMVIYDPNYISNAGFVTVPKIKKYIKTNNIKVNGELKVIGNRAIPIFKFDTIISCASFWDYIDVIYSSKDIYCLVTGTATLASAIGKKANIFYTKDQHPMFRHSKNNNYIEL